MPVLRMDTQSATERGWLTFHFTKIVDTCEQLPLEETQAIHPVHMPLYTYNHLSAKLAFIILQKI